MRLLFIKEVANLILKKLKIDFLKKNTIVNAQRDIRRVTTKSD